MVMSFSDINIAGCVCIQMKVFSGSIAELPLTNVWVLTAVLYNLWGLSMEIIISCLLNAYCAPSIVRFF